MKAYSRSSPYLARMKERELLTKTSSSKKTYHIALDTAGWGSSYQVGDSVGIFVQNDPKEVNLVLERMHATGAEEIVDFRLKTTCTLSSFLTYKANLSRVNRSFFQLIAERQKGSFLPLLERPEELSLFLQSHSLAELLKNTKILPEEVAKFAMPLLPRFYSIANSSRVFPEEIHLLVAYVEYVTHGEHKKGVASQFLCDAVELEDTLIPIYIQPSNHFTLPEDPNASLILIGPGTGVAPFRAFLQERVALQSSGRNWLFFGERNQATDFYYEPFWKELVKQGKLRLDAAFSRDFAEKRYVQHLLWERRKSLWEWLADGAFLFICGNADKMAKDVDAMLHKIVEEEGKLSAEKAISFIKDLRKSRRYLLDVY